MRRLGVAMGRAGESSNRVTEILDDVARRYAEGVTFFVVPTGVFVRIDLDGSSRVDFEAGTMTPLRLDQVDALYRLIDHLRLGSITVEDATRRLDALMTGRPRFGPVVSVAGCAVLTVGLGLMLTPTAGTIPILLVLGLVVGTLQVLGRRWTTLDLVLPVVAAFLVSWVATAWLAPALRVPTQHVVIPALVTFLPGAALTTATVELSGGSILSGSARLVYGLQRLLLLTFGILTGAHLVRSATQVTEATAMGAWAPWLGVLVFGVGQYLASSAPRRTLGWLLLVLYATYGVQVLTGSVVGPLGASMAAAAIALPVCYAIQSRRSGPPVPVTFLPAFWLMVPGALGLSGVAQLVGADAAAGLGDFVNALMTIVAIAVGVLVGAGLSEGIGRATSTWRGT